MSANKGLLIIVTGPSAVGKGAIVRVLLGRCPEVRFSVSVTTRPRRPHETDGVEYHFVTRREFERKIAADELLEWAEVYGHYYGTCRNQVDAALARGDDMILDIDRVGANRVKELYPDAVSVFVLPPSMAELERRMRGRGTEGEDAVRRLKEAPSWIRDGYEYQYVLINDDLDAAVEKLRAILVAEKCRTARGGQELIRTLLEKGEVEV